MTDKVKKNIHHIHDKSYKHLYSNKEIALDLFKNHLRECSWPEDLKIGDLELINKSFISPEFSDLESDIVYKVKINGEEVIFYILLEFQSSNDYTMPLRLLFYMCEILRSHYNSNAKILKDFRNDPKFKIPAIIPIVLYNGKQKWDVSIEFKDLIKNSNLFSNGLLNFRYDLFDVNSSDKEELLNSKTATSVIFLLDQKVDVLEFYERILQVAKFFNELTASTREVIKQWIANSVEDEVATTALNILDSEGKSMPIVPNNINIATEQREKMALLEDENRKLKESVEKTIKESTEKTIRNMIDKNLELDFIIGVIDSLSKDEVEKIYHKYKQ